MGKFSSKSKLLPRLYYIDIGNVALQSTTQNYTNWQDYSEMHCPYSYQINKVVSEEITQAHS